MKKLPLLFLCLIALVCFGNSIPIQQQAAFFSAKPPVTGGGGGGGATAFIVSGQGAARGSFDGVVGFKFTATADGTFTFLGRLVLSGNTQVHRVYLTDVSGNEIIHADVPTSGITANTYNKVAIASTPMVNGTTYFVVSAETSAGDQWAADTVVTTTADGTILESCFSVNPPPTAFSTGTSGSHSWVNPNFFYTKP